ncbi:hypothetical protein GO495_09460 [Chitinophaga oryziterrae]|uniref:Uncharacterized protein n=1 Tax=Chitinophaga oryziterrae TaxID=1031224 RepID=A0A6N8J7A7_9BACT|nr:hypothetical protein [Chitinophaga oryziterrae]MVT40804.1 hypothetical protein [Chitinophaga oryziterrae]
MNYILHLQNFYYLVERDKRLKPWHITLYFALFNTWHKYHFTSVFRISRNLLMNGSHIGSKNTLAKTLRQLHEYGYIIYQPALHKGHYPKVTVIRLTDHEIVRNQLNLFPDGRTGSVVSDGRPTMQEVLNWFNKRHVTRETALSFYSYYDWTENDPPFKNWQEAASNWLLHLNTKFYIQHDANNEGEF